MSIIEERRSIRKFTEQLLDDKTIAALIAKAAYAPSWKNAQPIRYIAVRDAVLKKKIAEECVMGFAGNQSIIENINGELNTTSSNSLRLSAIRCFTKQFNENFSAENFLDNSSVK